MRTTAYFPPSTHSRSLVDRLILTLGLTALGVFVILLILGLGFQLIYSDRIFPGVAVDGIDLSGLTVNEAAARLEQSLDFPHRGKIIFQFEQSTWSASPAELGLYLDPQATALAAYNQGRDSNLFDNLANQIRLWRSGKNLTPTLVLDERMAYSFIINNLSSSINRPVIEAALGLQGMDVIVNSGQIGREVNIPATLELVRRQVQSLQTGVIPVVVDESAPVVVDVSQQAELARQILSQPLVLTMPEGQPDQAGPWSFDPQTLAGMLRIELVAAEGGARYQVTLDSEALRSFLNNLTQPLALSPENARFIFNDETGQLEVLKPAVIGRQLDVETSIQSIQQKLTLGQHSIPLEFTINKPAVTDDMTGDQLGIRELVHSETSYFYGSASSRVQNIQIASARFHGLLIAPGETFSMSDAMGDVSLDNGYAEALIIIGGRTIKGVGGGVCQVSTTLFRAAFFAGFPIVERHAHAYRVSYYEKVKGNRIDPNLAGLDATVYFPLVDFKFTNDTPYWLLMETYVNPSSSSLTWKFYSTKDGRSVDWTTTGPTNKTPAPDPVYRENPDLSKGEIKQVEWPSEGADILVNRSVYRDGALYFQDSYSTHYQPWGEVFEYGPGTEGIPTPNSSNSSSTP